MGDRGASKNHPEAEEREDAQGENGEWNEPRQVGVIEPAVHHTSTGAAMLHAFDRRDPEEVETSRELLSSQRGQPEAARPRGSGRLEHRAVAVKRAERFRDVVQVFRDQMRLMCRHRLVKLIPDLQ